MKRTTLHPLLLAFALLFLPTTTLAGEALPQLKGKWNAASMGGIELPEGAMSMEFVDDKKVLMHFNGQDSNEYLYTATKDGAITIDGDVCKWEIKDGKLHINGEMDGRAQLIILKRPS